MRDASELEIRVAKTIGLLQAVGQMSTATASRATGRKSVAAALGTEKGDRHHLPHSGPKGASHKWCPSPFSLPTARSSIGRGRQPLTLEGGVRFPYGLLGKLSGDECTKVARALRKRPGMGSIPIVASSCKVS